MVGIKIFLSLSIYVWWVWINIFLSLSIYVWWVWICLSVTVWLGWMTNVGVFLPDHRKLWGFSLSVSLSFCHFFYESSHFITDIRNNFMNLLLWVLCLFLSISFMLWFPLELLTRSRWGHLPVNRFVDFWRQQMKKLFPFLQLWIHKLWKMTHFFNIV